MTLLLAAVPNIPLPQWIASDADLRLTLAAARPSLGSVQAQYRTWHILGWRYGFGMYADSRPCSRLVQPWTLSSRCVIKTGFALLYSPSILSSFLSCYLLLAVPLFALTHYCLLSPHSFHSFVIFCPFSSSGIRHPGSHLPIAPPLARLRPPAPPWRRPSH